MGVIKWTQLSFAPLHVFRAESLVPCDLSPLLLQLSKIKFQCITNNNIIRMITSMLSKTLLTQLGTPSVNYQCRHYETHTYVIVSYGWLCGHLLSIFVTCIFRSNYAVNAKGVSDSMITVAWLHFLSPSGHLSQARSNRRGGGWERRYESPASLHRDCTMVPASICGNAWSCDQLCRLTVSQTVWDCFVFFCNLHNLERIGFVFVSCFFRWRLWNAQRWQNKR